VSAQTGLQYDQQANQDYATAIAALTGANSADLANSNQPIAQLLAVVQALTGAQTTTTGTQNTSSTSNLVNAINELTGSSTSSDTVSSLAQILSQLTQSDQSATATANSTQNTT
jgi:hypothetical protein